MRRCQAPAGVAWTAERAEDVQRLPIENPDLLVAAVRNIREPLLRIRGKGDAKHGSIQRLGLDQLLLDERAVERKDLDPAAVSIAGVDEAIMADADAVHGRELLEPLVRIVPEANRIVGPLPVRPPVTLVL